MRRQLVFVVIAAFAVLASSEKCEDGVDNLLHIYDLLGDEAHIKFTNITAATYDDKKRPLCADGAATVQFPGYIRLVKGQIEVVKPVTMSKTRVRVEYTSEHSSFFIGQVCIDGKSQSSFVPDDLCQGELCALIGKDICARMEEKQVIDVSQTSDNYVHLPDTPINTLGGQWRLSVRVVSEDDDKKKAKTTMAHIRVSEEDAWIPIATNEEREEL